MRWQFCVIMALLLPASATAQDAGRPSSAPAAAEVYPEPANADVKKLAPRNAERSPSEPFRPDASKISNADSQNSMCLLLEAAARSNGLPVEFFARVIWQE